MDNRDALIKQYLSKIYSPEEEDQMAQDSSDRAQSALMTKDFQTAANMAGSINGEYAKSPTASLDAIAAKDKDIQDYVQKLREKRETAQAKLLEPATYDYVQGANNEIVGVNKKNPGDVVKTGVTKFEKPERPEKTTFHESNRTSDTGEALVMDDKGNYYVAGTKKPYTGNPATPDKPGNEFKSLPKENQLSIEELAKKNANKTSIANQMSGYLEQYRAAPTESSKVTIGRQMLKVLNSPEGSDAVGAEEAKRLGSLLEFHLFNLTEPGPVVGRDTKAFDEQVVNTINAVQSGIKKNNELITQYKGGGVPALPPAISLPSESKGSGTATASSSNQKTVVKKQYSPSRNQTKFVYSDGSQEIKDGQQ